MPKIPSLVCILPNPTQYDPPLWRTLTSRGRVHPRVLYFSENVPLDPEIGLVPKWGIPLTGYDWKSVSPFQVVAAVQTALNQGACTVVAAGWKEPTTWLALALARASSAKTVVCSDKTEENVSSAYLGSALRIFHRLRSNLFDYHWTTGKRGSALLNSYGIGDKRIIRGLYPVDTQYWQCALIAQAEESRSLRNRMGGIGTKNLLVVAKMSAREAPLDVIEAFACWAQRDAAARLIFVGDGNLRSEVDRAIARLGMIDRVHLAGHVAYGSLATYYGAADMFLHMPEREPWGISILEAMACGVPVVATSVVGAAVDTVVEGKTGWISPAGDPDSVGQTISKLAMHLEHLSKEHMSLVVGQFDVNSVADNLEQLVLQSERPSRGM